MNAAFDGNESTSLRGDASVDSVEDAWTMIREESNEWIAALNFFN